MLVRKAEEHMAVVHMVVHLEVRMLVVDMLVYMVQHEARKVEDMLVCIVPTVEHKVADKTVLHHEKDMMVEIPVCLAQIVEHKVEDMLVGKAHYRSARLNYKLVRRVHNYHSSDWRNIPSRGVPKHSIKATRLTFPVVFSLKTPCVKVLFC